MVKLGRNFNQSVNVKAAPQEAESVEAAEEAYANAHADYVARLTTRDKPRFGEIPGYQPEWFREAYQAEIENTDFEDPTYLQSVTALSAMRDGDFGPLAALLKERPDLPAVIRREIVFMIEGDADQSGGNRLVLESHPEVDKRKGGRHKQIKQYIRDQSIAAFIASKGGLTRKTKVAFFEAEKLFGIKRAQLSKIWNLHRDWAKGLWLGER